MLLSLEHPDFYRDIVKHIVGLTIARSQASWAIFSHQSNQLLAARRTSWLDWWKNWCLLDRLLVLFLRTVLPAVVDHTRLVHLNLQGDGYQSDFKVQTELRDSENDQDVTQTSGLVRPSGLYRTLPPGKGLERLEL